MPHSSPLSLARLAASSLSVSSAPCGWQPEDQGFQPKAGSICFSGSCLLPDGRFLVTGEIFPPKTTADFGSSVSDLDTLQEGWDWLRESVSTLLQGFGGEEKRWYPTVSPLPEGRVWRFNRLKEEG